MFRTTLATLLAVCSLSAGATVGEFDNECAWELTRNRHVSTDCSINMTRRDGKTYCFSNDRALTAFMMNPGQNAETASGVFDQRFLANLGRPSMGNTASNPTRLAAAAWLHVS